MHRKNTKGKYEERKRNRKRKSERVLGSSTLSLSLSVSLSVSYCANETLTCTPALVVVIGAVVAILGMTRFCSK